MATRATFKVGDRVKCIDTSPHAGGDCAHLSHDIVYVVAQASALSIRIASTWWRNRRFVLAESNVADYED